MINALVNEDEPSGEISCLQRKDLILGLQTSRNFHYFNRDRLGRTLKSKSLPSNFRILLEASILSGNPELGNEDAFVGNAQVQLELESAGDFPSYTLGPRSLSMPNRTNQNQEMNFSKFCIDDFTANSSTAPVADEDLNLSQLLAADLHSLPVPIVQSDGYVRSLSAKEIELSEDYTCIISYGPNSKTTHIFGDCIVDCHSNYLCTGTEDGQGVEVPHMAESKGVAIPHPFNGSLRQCLLCKKKLGDDEEISECETSLCGGECLSEEIIGEAFENIQDCSHEDAYGSCNTDSLFTFCTPLAI